MTDAEDFRAALRTVLFARCVVNGDQDKAFNISLGVPDEAMVLVLVGMLSRLLGESFPKKADQLQWLDNLAVLLQIDQDQQSAPKEKR